MQTNTEYMFEKYAKFSLSDLKAFFKSKKNIEQGVKVNSTEMSKILHENASLKQALSDASAVNEEATNALAQANAHKRNLAIAVGAGAGIGGYFISKKINQAPTPEPMAVEPTLSYIPGNGVSNE